METAAATLNRRRRDGLPQDDPDRGGTNVKLRNIGRRARLLMAAGLGGAAALVAITGSAAAVAGPSCQPGSGKQLAGQQLTGSEVSSYQPGALRCADLAGANLSGLSLEQVDFTGANLRDANLRNANLTQAVINFADLSGADLANANMTQVTARHA